MEYLLLLLVPAVFLVGFGSDDSSTSEDPEIDEGGSDDPAPDTEGAIIGTDDSEILLGGTEDDALFGLDGDDTIGGYEGDDFVRAGDGDDLVITDSGNDTIYGGNGHDVIIAGDGEDVAYGGLQDDVFAGYSLDEGVADAELIQDTHLEVIEQAAPDLTDTTGADRFEGGYGDDLFLLGGNDTATGGEGADTFAMRNDVDGVATITDFTPGEDVIVLSFSSTGSSSWYVTDDADGNAVIFFEGDEALVIEGMAGQVTSEDIRFLRR